MISSFDQSLPGDVNSRPLLFWHQDFTKTKQKKELLVSIGEKGKPKLFCVSSLENTQNLPKELC